MINAVGVLRDSAGRPLQAMHADAPIALFDACAAAGVRRVVQISALGIAHSATRYASTKRAADEHLLALTEQGRLNGCVLRPSVVFGAGGASSQLFLALARLPACCCRARCCKRACSPWPCATGRRGGARGGFGCAVGLVEIGGPEALPLAQLIASLRAQMGQAGLCRPAARLVEPGQRARGDGLPWSPWCSETLALLESDNVTDPAALERWLGRPGVAPGQLLATLRRD